MQGNFGAALAFVLRPDIDGQPCHQTPGDAGGWTWFGITYAVACAYFASEGRARPSMADLDTWTAGSPIVATIYRKLYWDATRCETLPPGVDLMVFDEAVNAGPPTAARLLQRIVGTATDGRIGALTLAALAYWRADALLNAYHTAREAYYAKLPADREFGRGWTRRDADALAAAHVEAGKLLPVAAAVEPPSGPAEELTSVALAAALA